MKFSALNKEGSNSGATPARKSSKPTKEAQESACLQLYRTALKCQQDGKLEEAKSLYRDILDSEVLQEVDQGRTEGASVETSPVLKVKYLTYKNMASIAKEQGDFSAALEAYIQASSINGSEVVLWCQMASSAVSLGNLLLARKAFEQALRCNESYWPAIEGLSSVLFALEDYRACLVLLLKVLNAEPDFPRGIAYIHSINGKQPDLISTLPDLQIHLMTPWLPQYSKYLCEADEMRKRRRALCDVDIIQEPVAPLSKLSALSVGSLGRFLLATYHHCQQAPSSLLNCAVPVDLANLVVEQSLEKEVSVPMDTSAGCLSPIKSAPPAKDGSQLPLEDTGSGEEGGRRDLKRKGLEAESCLAPKRRSTRVRSKQQEPTVRFGTLQKYIPPCLRQCMTAELADLSPLKKPPSSIEESVRRTDRQSVALLVEKTGQLPEPDTVLQFTEQHKANSGVINLMYNYVLMLSSQYDQKWSCSTTPPVSKVFVEVYEVLHKHLVYPSPFCLDDAERAEYALQLAEIALCYIELSIDAMMSGRSAQAPRKTTDGSSSGVARKCFHDCLGFVQLCGVQIMGDKQKVFNVRVSWALARWRVIQGDNAAATLALRKCQQDFEACRDAAGGGVIYLCNQQEDQFISSAHIAEKLKLIEQSVSLDQVAHLFNTKEYSLVVERLSSVLMQEIGSFTEFLIGSEKCGTEETGLLMLIVSLINLNKIKECIECCIQALHALLVDYRIGNEQWVQALRFIFVTMEKHLDVKLLEELELKAVKQLLLCVLKTIDVTCDITEPMLLLLMPICIPWKIFYIIISSNWQGRTEEGKKLEEGMAMDSHSHVLNLDKAVETMESVECLTSLRTEKTMVSVVPMVTMASVAVTMAPVVTMDTAVTMAPVVTMDTAVTMAPVVTMDTAVTMAPVVTMDTAVAMAPVVTMDTAVAMAPVVTMDTAVAMAPVDTTIAATPMGVVPAVTMGTTQGSTAELSVSVECVNPSDSLWSAPLLDSTQPTELTRMECAEPMEMDTHISSDVSIGTMSTLIATPTSLSISTPSAAVTVAMPTTVIDTSTSTASFPSVPITPPTSASILTSLSTAPPTADAQTSQPLAPPKECPPQPPMGPCGPPSGDTLEQQVQLSEKHEELELHLQFLKEAHDYLGSLGWCCKDDGCFLQTSVSTLRGKLQVLSALPPKHRDILLQELEQCYYCLYGHPQKKAKARGLTEHNAEQLGQSCPEDAFQVPLTWEGALKLMEYFHCPYSSFSEVKNTYITAELLTLYKRITDIIPQDGRAQAFNALTDYIDGKIEFLIPPVCAQPHNSLIAEIFHILGDDSLKSQEHVKAIHYYQNSVSYVPDHFEAWTGLALSHSGKIYKQLDMRDSKTSLEKFLQKQVQQTVRCFEKAITLNSQSYFVLEKFGFFCYTIQSFASQMVQQRDLFPSDNSLLWATSMHTKMLTEAERCYQLAMKIEKSWSSSLMLGKTSYKRRVLPIPDMLEHFANAADILHRQGALYPPIVEQGCKGKAVEAIEAHYQLHACALKLLIQHKDKEHEKVVREALSKVAHLPLSTVTYPRIWEWVRQLSMGEASSSGPRSVVGEEKMDEAHCQDLDVESVMDSSDAGGGGVGDVWPGHLSIIATKHISNTSSVHSTSTCASPLLDGAAMSPLEKTPILTPSQGTPLVQGATAAPVLTPSQGATLVQGATAVPVLTPSQGATLVQGTTAVPVLTPSQGATLVQGTTAVPVLTPSQGATLVQGTTLTPSQGAPLVQGTTAAPVFQPPPEKTDASEAIGFSEIHVPLPPPLLLPFVDANIPLPSITSLSTFPPGMSASYKDVTPTSTPLLNVPTQLPSGGTFSGPQSLVERTFSGPQPLVEGTFSGPQSLVEGTFSGPQPLVGETFSGSQSLAEETFLSHLENLTKEPEVKFPYEAVTPDPITSLSGAPLLYPQSFAGETLFSVPQPPAKEIILSDLQSLLVDTLLPDIITQSLSADLTSHTASNSPVPVTSHTASNSPVPVTSHNIPVSVTSHIASNSPVPVTSHTASNSPVPVTSHNSPVSVTSHIASNSPVPVTSHTSSNSPVPVTCVHVASPYHILPLVVTSDAEAEAIPSLSGTQTTMPATLVKAVPALHQGSSSSVHQGSSSSVHQGSSSSVHPTVHQGSISSTAPVAPPHLLSHISTDLLEQCLYNIAVCIVRCPTYFKPLYRLSDVLDKMGLPKLAQELLLGPIPSHLLETQEKILPLFVQRTNIFTNQWQIPVEEINRPGTFPTHARKHLELLVNVLAQLGHTSILAYLCAQLKTRPDATKQYLRDNERVAMFKKIWMLCLTRLKAVYEEDVSTVDAEKLGNLLMEVYNLRTVTLRVDSQHHTKSSDAVMQNIYASLVAAEAKEAGSEVDPVTPSLEEATKYCQARLKKAQAFSDVAMATQSSSTSIPSTN